VNLIKKETTYTYEINQTERLALIGILAKLYIDHEIKIDASSWNIIKDLLMEFDREKVKEK
jgi:hypothetical protein